MTVLDTPLDREDVAGITDRLHEVFGIFADMTKGTGWHDIDDE